jgi:hypothetical protein
MPASGSYTAAQVASCTRTSGPSVSRSKASMPVEDAPPSVGPAPNKA